jgi:uncharacterized protein
VSSREVRDPVHGLIQFTQEEWAVIDSSPFQRLRGVQQLAYTHLVYPGARHSRFEHCLGAAHIAGEAAEAINRAADQEVVPTREVRLAALMHDVGHGPFSHVSEMVFEKRTGRSHIHEAISSAIIRHHPEIQSILTEEARNWCADLLAGTGHGERRSAERDIVAGPADIDKLDYLLRDSHYCGVNYGRYDLDKLVESARFQDDIGGSKLAYHVDGIYALEEMLLARYHMHRQVYGHRTRVATDLLLVRAMELGIDEGTLPATVFEPPEELAADFVSEYMQWDDNSVIRTLLSAGEPYVSSQIAASLIERNLPKRLLQVNSRDLEGRFGRELTGYIIEADQETLDLQLPELERHVAERLGIDPHWVFVHYDRRNSPTLRPFTAGIDSKDVVLVDDAGNIMIFHDVSEVFSRGEAEPRRGISLYARLPRGSEETVDEDEIGDAFFEGLNVLGRAAIGV